MNKLELVNYFRNPNELSKSDLRGLNLIIKKYPYFSSARILLTKRCKTLCLPITHKLIASTSIYVTNRTLFKKYLNGDLFFIHPPSTTSKDIGVNDTTLSSPNDSVESLDLMLKELEEDMKKLKSSREKFTLVQSQIVEEGATTSTAKDSEFPDIEKEIEKAIEEAIFAAIEKASKKKPNSITETSTTSQKKKERNIIDKFIESNPSVKPLTKETLKKENKSIEDLAKTSSSWNDEVASEYLAEIYLEQGNKKRAIDIYTSLSLIFPEKKAYFADLISKID